MNDLIQDAPDHYLMAGTPTRGRREAAYRAFCEQPMQITPEQFREVLQEDVLARIAGLPHTRVHELLPWNWKAARNQTLAA